MKTLEIINIFENAKSNKKINLKKEEAIKLAKVINREERLPLLKLYHLCLKITKDEEDAKKLACHLFDRDNQG